MKKIIIALAAFCAPFFATADEGMWLPFLISQNFDEMARLGFKLTPQDIYNVNKSSMKDAVVVFGGGCTGEAISQEGLILTNHHCGYDAIAGVSTVKKNYLMNGFAAQSRNEEIPCPGLSVQFLQRIDDVTDLVKKATKKTKSIADFDKKLEKLVLKLEEQEKKNGYNIAVRPFFSGNKYYMLVFERFTDVRLVATPSEGLGKFGGDTDNWVWPRHTADYSIFRVYGTNENKPNAYSENNVPYRPKYHFPISMKGHNEGDFSMVFGYPGRTTRYLTSYGVDAAITESNPSIVKIREKRLALLRDEMRKDPEVSLKYKSAYASIANYWKYFIGQTEQIKNQGVLALKQKEENEFKRWASDNNKSSEDLFTRYQSLYDGFKKVNRLSVYQREAFAASSLMRIASAFYGLNELMNKEGVKLEEIADRIKAIKGMRKATMKNTDIATDKKVFSNLMRMYAEDISTEQLPSIFKTAIFDKFGNGDRARAFDEFTEDLYSKSVLLDETELGKLLDNINKDNLQADPAVNFAYQIIENYKKNYEGQVISFGDNRFLLDKEYQAALMKKNEGKLMYPDANSTLRVTYGSIKAYQPKDAVSYSYYTTAAGLLEKYKDGDEEFDLEDKIVNLVKANDFGDYADKKAGTLITCFITNNDITGGNSGSPVINGNGELIGTAFDGNWEAMSGDISFDKKYKRTIVADIRYVLWSLDKVYGGHRIIEEMTIRK
jgi:hypothetical protein